ncbi:hypothetical protein KEX41_28650 (plasmid) [Burkholderia thailandensis]|uniref:hypothetical protein n=1 Tax=Burkholderia thailandensis TaxID=57975 RepID=UPI00192D5629|nr:hypothetical protein [Burkholderia thailandensis]QRA15260.1 hypothetical protein JMY07_29075 [Burkholderia thailandensis]
MNGYPYNFGRDIALTAAGIRNRTQLAICWLLLLSTALAIVGVWAGVATGFSLFAATSPAMNVLAIGFGFLFAVEHTENRRVPIVAVLAAHNSGRN